MIDAGHFGTGKHYRVEPQCHGVVRCGKSSTLVPTNGEVGDVYAVQSGERSRDSDSIGVPQSVLSSQAAPSSLYGLSRGGLFDIFTSSK